MRVAITRRDQCWSALPRFCFISRLRATVYLTTLPFFVLSLFDKNDNNNAYVGRSRPGRFFMFMTNTVVDWTVQNTFRVDTPPSLCPGSSIHGNLTLWDTRSMSRSAGDTSLTRNVKSVTSFVGTMSFLDEVCPVAYTLEGGGKG